MILNGSVGLFHATVTVARKSLRVWACAVPVSGNSATSANTSLFISPPVLACFFAQCRLGLGARPNLTTMRLNNNSPAAFGSRTRRTRRARRVLLRRVVAGDRLRLEIFLEAELAPFATVAGLLVAAERRGAVVRHALQVDVAGADLAADLAGALDGAGSDVTGQTIGRVVGDMDRVSFVLGADDHEHRPENLLAGDGHVGRHVGEDGR